MNTNTQNVCPFCGGPGYHVRGCQRLQQKQASNWCEEHQFNYSDDPELGCPWCECKHLKEVADGIDALTELNNQHCETIGQLEEQLDTIEDVLMRTESELDSANKAANEAQSQFQKAKEWNALCELELKTLRESMDNAEEDMSRAGLREGQAMETIYLLKNSLLELCEKMEAGISGQEETKRARLLLEEIKANQEKK